MKPCLPRDCVPRCWGQFTMSSVNRPHEAGRPNRLKATGARHVSALNQVGQHRPTCSPGGFRAGAESVVLPKRALHVSGPQRSGHSILGTGFGRTSP